jgi:hypothetical protein
MNMPVGIACSAGHRLTFTLARPSLMRIVIASIFIGAVRESIFQHPG